MFTVTDLETKKTYEFINLAHLIYFIVFQTVECNLDFMGELNRSGKDKCNEPLSSVQSSYRWRMGFRPVYWVEVGRAKRFIVRDEYNRIISLKEQEKKIEETIKAVRKDRTLLNKLRKELGLDADKLKREYKMLPNFRGGPVPGTRNGRKYYNFIFRRYLKTKATAVAISDVDYGKFLRNKRKEVAYVGSYFYDAYRTPDKSWKKQSKARKQYMKNSKNISKKGCKSLRDINKAEVAQLELEELFSMAFIDDDVA